jgi:hypothetical protein
MHALCPLIPNRGLLMPCFFHLMDGQESILDEEGLEVTDIQAVHAYALEATQELRQETGLCFDDWQGWQLIAADEGGEILLSVWLDRPQPEPRATWSFVAGELWVQQSGSWTAATPH